MTPKALIALAREYRDQNGGVFGIVLRRDWSEDVLTLEPLLERALAALRRAEPYVIGTDDVDLVQASAREIGEALVAPFSPRE